MQASDEELHMALKDLHTINVDGKRKLIIIEKEDDDRWPLAIEE